VLKYVAKVHGGFMPTVRTALFKRFHGLETKTCPFKNLPEARRGQWGEELMAAEMEKCSGFKPRLVMTIRLRRAYCRESLATPDICRNGRATDIRNPHADL